MSDAGFGLAIVDFGIKKNAPVPLKRAEGSPCQKPGVSTPGNKVLRVKSLGFQPQETEAFPFFYVYEIFSSRVLVIM
jgi:hypothetical protein